MHVTLSVVGDIRFFWLSAWRHSKNTFMDKQDSTVRKFSSDGHRLEFGKRLMCKSTYHSVNKQNRQRHSKHVLYIMLSTCPQTYERGGNFASCFDVRTEQLHVLQSCSFHLSRFCRIRPRSSKHVLFLLPTVTWLASNSSLRICNRNQFIIT